MAKRKTRLTMTKQDDGSWIIYYSKSDADMNQKTPEMLNEMIGELTAMRDDLFKRINA